MLERAGLTTAMSSMSIAVATQTTARGPRWGGGTEVAPGDRGEERGRRACSRPAAGSTSGESLVDRLDVAGGAEDVVGVPARLHAREPFVGGPVGRADAVHAGVG